MFLTIRTFRCTLTSIPQTQALLNKARLPLGLLLHPFRDLQVGYFILYITPPVPSAILAHVFSILTDYFLDISLDTWCINRFRGFQTCSRCLEKVTPEVKLGRKCVEFSSQTLLLVTSFASIFASSRLQQLPVITSNTIVRCRSCRTYINPFVTFLDQRRWKCNLCYRINDGKSPAYN